MNVQSMVQLLNNNSKWNYLNSAFNLNSKFNSCLLNPMKFQQKKNLTTTYLNTKSLLLNNTNDLIKVNSNIELSKIYLYKNNNSLSKRYYSTPSGNNNNNNNNNKNNEKNIKDSSNATPSGTSGNENSKKDNNKNNKKGYRPNPIISFVFFIVGASAGSFLAHELFEILDELRRIYHDQRLSAVGRNKALDDDDDFIPNPDDPELTPAMVTRFLRKHEFSTFSKEEKKEEEKSEEIQDENNENASINKKDESKAISQNNTTSVIGYV